MPEQINRKQSTMHNQKRELTFAENIEIQLKAGETIESIEIATQEHIEDAEKELQRVKDGKAANDVIAAAAKRLAKWQAFSKVVAKYKNSISIENEIKEQVKKATKINEELTKLGEEIVDYIAQIDVNNLGDITAKKKYLLERINNYKNTVKLSIEINKKTVSLLNDLKELKPDYDVYEQYRNLIPKYEGKSVDYVKEKYKETMLKIKALEDKKSTTTFLNDRKNYDALIQELKNYIDEVLPYLLSNPKQFEFIKAEVAKELGVEYQPPQDEDLGKGEQKGAGDTDSGDTDTGVQGTATGDSDTDKDKKPEPVVPPITGKDNPKFKSAKEEYIHIIESINKLVDRLNDLNLSQDQLAFNPELNYERMISTELEVLKINAKINEYKDALTELEYRKYVEEHIMLNLDPEIKDLKPKEPDYNGDLEQFMELHNSVIAGCYARLHEIADTPDYQNNPELVNESKKLLEVIDAQHLVINRRLIAERHKNKDFDMIAFMQSHKVDSKQVTKPKEPESITPSDENKPKTEPVNEDKAYKQLEKQIKEFKQNLLTLYIAEYLLKLKISTVSQIDSEKLAIAEQIAQLEKDIREAIDASGLSEEKRMILHNRVDGAKIEASTEIDNRFASLANVHQLREDFVKEVRVLMMYSEQLIELSKVSTNSQEYKAMIAQYYQKIEEIKVKFAKYDVKVSVDSVTSKTKITIGEKSGLNMSVISAEQKTTTETITLSVMTLEKEQEMKKQTTVKIPRTKLNFGGKIQDVDRREAIIGTMNKLRITLLKNSIRVQYTKQMLEELKGLRVRLEVAAAAENKNDIQVTKAVDTKDGTKEYRHIKNPTKLTEAKLIYRDLDTNEELVSYDVLSNEQIQEALEERRRMSR